MSRRPRIAVRELAGAYLLAKRTVLEAGYAAEIAWQEDACDAPLTETRFLSEAAWVVLSSGMREAVVRRLFPRIAAAFGEFVSARVAAASADTGGRAEALGVFGHEGKIDAIVSIVAHVDEQGIQEVRRRLAVDGLTYLRRFPYVGPVTAFHLAKNLGHDVAKPDRHLVRIALACGYGDPQDLCVELCGFLGEPVPVVDLVLWRYATLSRHYLTKLLEHATATSPTA